MNIRISDGATLHLTASTTAGKDILLETQNQGDKAKLFASIPSDQDGYFRASWDHQPSGKSVLRFTPCDAVVEKDAPEKLPTQAVVVEPQVDLTASLNDLKVELSHRSAEDLETLAAQAGVRVQSNWSSDTVLRKIAEGMIKKGVRL